MAGLLVGTAALVATGRCGQRPLQQLRRSAALWTLKVRFGGASAAWGSSRPLLLWGRCPGFPGSCSVLSGPGSAAVCAPRSFSIPEFAVEPTGEAFLVAEITPEDPGRQA